MKRHRTLHRQLQLHGELPDAGWGTGPDSRVLARAIRSGMSPITEPVAAADEYETEVVIFEARATAFSAPTGWRPAVNAYRCHEKFVIFVDLAGVAPESIKLTVQPDRLTIQGSRPAPEPDGDASDTCQLLALEIDNGSFERTLELPQTVNPDAVTTEFRNGLLRIALGLRT